MPEMYSKSEGGFHSMSKILKVTPNDDYTLLVEFEHGNKIIFNMRDIVKTIPFSSLEDLSRFKDITLEERPYAGLSRSQRKHHAPSPDGQHAAAIRVKSMSGTIIEKGEYIS